jgi:MFS family permease
LESASAWLRLTASLLLGTIGGVGMWSVVVALPLIQAEFGLARGPASLPYTMTMLGFAGGSVLMGRLADRFGIVFPVVAGALSLSVGYVLAAQSASLWQFIALQGVAIGLFGCSATFSPLIADISHWFTRRRGIAVAICASGSYLAGTIWPPVLQRLMENFGWRETYTGIGIFCAATMLPLALALRRPSPVHDSGVTSSGSGSQAPIPALGISTNALQGLLVLAGLACCIAMSMPQVHIVAYCADLGYGVARGAEMLSLMLGGGVVSRLASGWICDRIGGARTLVLGSALQCLTLAFYIPFDGLISLYAVSALFGLSQGGIVPTYAMIVRDYFPPKEAATRVGTVLMATIVGMALGGWMSGVIFDLTGSYQAAFLNGILWNMLNLGIALWLMRAQRDLRALAA